jgi:RNA polymerase sigma factor (TIGR02999 family)
MNDQAPVPSSPDSPQPATQLLPQVYDELRRLAAWRLATEPAGQTLQPTALVHEAWLRLHVGAPAVWANRAHFFAAAAEAMRRILIENARRKQALRHGGGLQRVDVSEVEIAAPADDPELLAVDEALAQFEQVDPDIATLVKLRYFARFTLEEAAAALGISLATAKRQWVYARAWLFRALKKNEPFDGPSAHD